MAARKTILHDLFPRFAIKNMSKRSILFFSDKCAHKNMGLLSYVQIAMNEKLPVINS
jgi:hypothetical protein